MRPPLRDRVLQFMAGAAASSPLLSMPAHAGPVYGADISGGIEYSKNPFLTASNNASAVRADASISPYVEIDGPRSQFRLGGTLSHSTYSRIYDDSTDYILRADYSQTLSPRLSMHANGAFNSSANGNYAPEAVSLTGIPNPLPAANDVTLIGSQARYIQFRNAVGVNYTADPRNSLSLDYSAVVVRLPDTPRVAGVRQGEYTSIAQNFGYNRVISARWTVGLSMGVNRINYLGTSLGDSTILTPNLNATWRLTGKWSLSGGLGVSILRQTTFFGPDTSRNLSASLSACRTDLRDSFCFSGARDVSPSSLGSARKTTSLGASYSYRLNARDTLSATGNFVQSDEAFLGPATKVNFLSGGLGFKRQFNNRFALDVNAGFSRSEFQSTRNDARVGIGLSYHLDNRR